MRSVVYVDVLFGLNLAINYLLLWVTAKLSKQHSRWWRVLIGATVGALYAVLMFFPNMKVFYSVIAKILFSAGLIAITFKVNRLREFVRILFLFYVVSFAFAGSAIAVFYYTNIGVEIGAMLSNGVFYFNISAKTLVISAVICYILITAASKLVARYVGRDKLYTNVSVAFGGASSVVKALVDTGNSLVDPISSYPVMVVEIEAIKQMLPDEMAKMMREKGGLYATSKIMMDSEWATRFRLIPFNSLGMENGLLVGFKPDSIEIVDTQQPKILEKVVVAIYTQKLSSNGSYQALLNPEMIT